MNRLTLLIHGYNNDACNALDEYDRFLTLTGVNDPAVCAALGEVCQFYWPGDSRALGGVSYPEEIPRAIASAVLLSGYLRRLAEGRTSPLEIRVVCHSLGNRVALELVKDYLAAGAPRTIRFAGVLMMAAAVKVSMVEDEGDLRAAATALGATLVLYSENDTVLKWGFPFGEFAAGEGFGTAVGRFGEPTNGVWQQRREMSPYNHGDYWSGDNTAPQVRSWLGLSTDRVIAARSLTDEPGPQAAGLSGRSLRARQLGDSISTCHCN